MTPLTSAVPSGTIDGLVMEMRKLVTSSTSTSAKGERGGALKSVWSVGRTASHRLTWLLPPKDAYKGKNTPSMCRRRLSSSVGKQENCCKCFPLFCFCVAQVYIG